MTLDFGPPIAEGTRRQVGAARVLAKPFALAELIARVDPLVRAPSPSSQAA